MITTGAKKELILVTPSISGFGAAGSGLGGPQSTASRMAEVHMDISRGRIENIKNMVGEQSKFMQNQEG